MTSPDEKQLQETPDAAAGTMVRACDRCGTVCSTDQEWCLNCGVRMTEPSQRLPGLRAAALVVALATLLAGGAAAASYAALRGDERSAANVPAETTPAPVAQVPSTTAPVAPVPTTDTTASVPESTPAPDTSDLDTSGDSSADTSGSAADTGAGSTSSITPTPTPGAGTSSGARPSTANPGSTGSGSTGKGSTGSGSTGKGSGKKEEDPKTPTTPSGPVEFAAGQGSIYDPDGVVADRGEEASAIDGSTGTSWKVELAPEQTGGFGYVVDFTPATKLKTLNVVSGTAGATVKILGTTSSALPKDALDNGWDTIADETTLKKGDNSIALQAASGASSKYRHVLVFVTEAPGTPAALAIREIQATR